MPDEATDNGQSAADVDVDALFAALREEIRRSGADPGAAGEAGEDDRQAARAEAERLWPVSADRPLRLRPGVRGGIGTPAKAVLKKGMRWYVEPLAYDQRSFNAAALRLIDDLEQRVAALEAELALPLRGAGVAPMRIAVLRPQVPFARGGAEIFTDTLVHELQARARRGPRLGAVQVVSGRARADTGVPLADARPRGGGRTEDRHRRRDEVPQLRRAPSREARLARPPVPPGVRARRDGARPVRPLARGPGAAAPGAGARPDRARRGDAPLRHVRERRRAARAVHRPRGGGAPAPAAAAPVPERAVRGVRPLGEPARPRERIDLLLEAAALEPAVDVVVASDGPDRERLEAIARERGLDGRVRFEGRVSEERLAELYATCSSVFYAPVDEDFGMGPYEAFLSGKPVITTTDAGGPLDVVHDRTTGLVVAPEPAEIGKAAAWLREHLDDAAAFGSAGKAIADEVTWDRAIARLLS